MFIFINSCSIVLILLLLILLHKTTSLFNNSSIGFSCEDYNLNFFDISSILCSILFKYLHCVGAHWSLSESFGESFLFNFNFNKSSVISYLWISNFWASLPKQCFRKTLFISSKSVYASKVSRHLSQYSWYMFPLSHFLVDNLK